MNSTLSSGDWWIANSPRHFQQGARGVLRCSRANSCSLIATAQGQFSSTDVILSCLVLPYLVLPYSTYKTPDSLGRQSESGDRLSDFSMDFKNIFALHFFAECILCRLVPGTDVPDAN